MKATWNVLGLTPDIPLWPTNAAYAPCVVPVPCATPAAWVACAAPMALRPLWPLWPTSGSCGPCGKSGFLDVYVNILLTFLAIWSKSCTSGSLATKDLSDSNPYSGVELRPWTLQWDLTLHLLIWTVSHRSLHHWSGTLLVRLYKDNASILGPLRQSVHLTSFGWLLNSSLWANWLDLKS